RAVGDRAAVPRAALRHPRARADHRGVLARRDGAAGSLRGAPRDADRLPRALRSREVRRLSPRSRRVARDARRGARLRRGHADTGGSVMFGVDLTHPWFLLLLPAALIAWWWSSVSGGRVLFSSLRALPASGRGNGST